MSGKIWRYAGLAGLVLLVLIGALALWLKLFFPAREVKSFVESRVTKSTGRQCTVHDLALSIWRGFAIDLEGVEIASKEPEKSPCLLHAEHLFLKVRLLPLFWKRIEVISISLSHPVIYIEKDERGELNLSKAVTAAKGEKPEEKPGFSVVLLSARIDQAALHYLDREKGLQLDCGPLGARFSLGRADERGVMSFTGKVELEGASSDSLKFLSRLDRAFPLTVNCLGTANTKSGDFSFGKIQLAFDGIELQGQGELKPVAEKEYAYSFHVQGETDKLSSVLDLLQEVLGKPGVGILNALGQLSLEAALEGDTRAESSFDYRIGAALKSCGAELKGFPRPISELNAALSLDKENLSLENLSARLGSDSLSLSGTLALSEGYPAAFRLKTTLSINDLPQAVPAFRQWRADGRLEADLGIKTRLDNLPGLSLDGTLKGRSLSFRGPQAEKELTLPRADLLFSGHNLDRAVIELSCGQSRAQVDLGIKNFNYFLLPRKKSGTAPAVWTLEARSQILDLRDFLPKDSTAQGSAAAGGEKKNFTLPFALGQGSGTIQAERMIVSPEFSLEKVSLAFTARDSQLTIDRLTAGLFSGNLSGKGKIDLFTADRPATYVLDLDAAGVSAKELLAPFSTLGRYLSGAVSTVLHLRGRGFSVESFKENLSGEAEFTLKQGRLEGWPALNSLAGLTGIAELKELVIDEWIGKFVIAGQRVASDKLTLAAENNELALSGSAGFDGSLDYALELALSEKLGRKYRSLVPGEFAALLTGDSDRVVLGFKIGGNTASPTITWDRSQVKKRIQQKASQELSRQLEKLSDRLLPSKDRQSDSLGAKPDSTLDKAKQLLQKLFKPKKQP